MASLSIILYKTGKYKDGRIPVCLRLTINRISKYYPLGSTFRCFETQWDEKDFFLKGYSNHKAANRNLHFLLSKAEAILIEIENEKREISFDEFARRFNQKERRIYVLKYFDELIKRLNDSGHVGNAVVYSTCKRSLEGFLKKDIEIVDLTPKILNQYVEYLHELKPNSISNYLRTLRAVCNKALKEEGIKYYPFAGFEWKQLKNQTSKRAISKSEILKIMSYEPDEKSRIYNSLKYFVFSYLTWGLNFTDLAKLTRKNIHDVNGLKVLVYNRSKGGKLYDIPLSPKALEIVEYYKKTYPAARYIFPILDEEIHDTPKKIKTRIQTVLKTVNEDLKDVATSLGINVNLSTYVARHTFATVLKNQGQDISIISEMMGHDNPNTTQIYLKGFDYTDKIKASDKLTE